MKALRRSFFVQILVLPGAISLRCAIRGPMLVQANQCLEVARRAFRNCLSARFERESCASHLPFLQNRIQAAKLDRNKFIIEVIVSSYGHS